MMRTPSPIQALASLTVAGLVIALLTAAAASWVHLDLAFHAVEPDGAVWVPRLSATAVETGLLALAVAGALLMALRGLRDRAHIIVVYVSVVLFAAVSFAANVYAAIQARPDIDRITTGAVRRMEPLDWGVVVIGAGVLPVMVVLLTHVIMAVSGSLRSYAQGAPAPPPRVKPPVPQQKPTARLQDAHSRNGGHEHIRAIADAHPDWTQMQIATEAGVSLRTVSRAVAPRRANGHINAGQ